MRNEDFFPLPWPCSRVVGIIFTGLADSHLGFVVSLPIAWDIDWSKRSSSIFSGTVHRGNGRGYQYPLFRRETNLYGNGHLVQTELRDFVEAISTDVSFDKRRRFPMG